MGLQVGQGGITNIADGATPALVALDRLAGQMVSDSVARYSNLTKRGLVFCAALQAAVALSTLNATATGFILTNPSGSGKDLHLLDVVIHAATAPAGAGPIGLAANVNTVAAAVVHTTPLTVRSSFLGGSTTAVGLADSAATLPAAPVYVRHLGGGPVATGSISPPYVKDEVAGAIILQPGTAVSLSYLTTAISVLASMTWAELPS